METQANDYRDCGTEHLRDYPACYQECGHDACTALMHDTDPEPPAQPEPGPTPENPFEGYVDVTENIRMAKSQGWEVGRVAGDAVGYARGRAERDALVAELVEACDLVIEDDERGGWDATRALRGLRIALKAAKGES